jgi:O-acetyl-ADP-ribose deacetylase (regulator of RNase III)
MKIEYRKGDLLSAPYNSEHCRHILHIGNNRGVMGSGVAKAIINKYPQVKEDYLKFCKYTTLENRLGKIIVSDVSDSIENPYSICTNIYTIIGQDGFGYDGKKYINYQSTKEGLTKAFNKIILLSLTSPGLLVAEVAMPKIGAGLGGGDWGIISKIIETTAARLNSKFTPLEISIKPVVYEL